MNTAKNYQASITVNAAAEDVYNKIANVDGWWAQNFTGSAKATGDTFTVTFGNTFVDFRISEAVPGKKVAWHVTNCWLPWQNDKTEWNGTTVIFELAEHAGKTTVDMTHIGLTPEVECFKIAKAVGTGISKIVFLITLRKEKANRRRDNNLQTYEILKIS